MVPGTGEPPWRGVDCQKAMIESRPSEYLPLLSRRLDDGHRHHCSGCERVDALRDRAVQEVDDVCRDILHRAAPGKGVTSQQRKGLGREDLELRHDHAGGLVHLATYRGVPAASEASSSSAEQIAAVTAALTTWLARE